MTDLKTIACKSLDRIGIMDCYSNARKSITGSQIAILNYHSVKSCDVFKSHMEYLTANYEIIGLNYLVDAIRNKRTCPKKAIVITFDDGYKDNYTNAFPILKIYHAPATVFLVTGHIGTGELIWDQKVRYAFDNTTAQFIRIHELGTFDISNPTTRQKAMAKTLVKLKTLADEERDVHVEQIIEACRVMIPNDLGFKSLLSWEEVREMSDSNIDFGGHSVTHSILTNASPSRAKFEISECKKTIEAVIGKNVTHFAYPSGYYDERTIGYVREYGYECALAVSPNRLITSNDNLFCLSRIGAQDNLSKMKAGLSGLWGDLAPIIK